MDSLRDRINAWFEKYEVPWEGLMAVLAVVFVALALAPGHPLFVAIDIAISLVFLTEFTVRIAAARSRSHYLLHHWMDVVALIPAIPVYQDASWARIARLLRLLMVLRLMGGLDRVTHHVQGVTAQPGLTFLIGAITALVLSVAAINHLVEGKINEGLNSFGNALYWGIVTVTTVGYGDIVPKTALGRSLGVLLMVGGLILWSLMTASIINYLAEFSRARHRQHDNHAVEEAKEKLDRLDALSADELSALRGAVVALIEQRLNVRNAPPQQLPVEKSEEKTSS